MPSPHTVLTEEAFRKIKRAVMEGKNLKEIAEVLGVSEWTVYDWSHENYLKFRDKVDGWKRDYLLSLSERNLEEDLQMNTIVPVVTMAGVLKNPETGEVVTKISPELRKIRASQSQFVAETLGNSHYNKKIKQEHSNRTLEDILREADEDEDDDEKDTAEVDAGAFVDSEQEAQGAAIPAEQGTNGLPQQSNPAQPAANNNTQG